MKPQYLQPILQPLYMKQFSCIGSSCEDTCCAIWRVDIDRGTYKKYNKVSDPELKRLLRDHFVRNRDNPSDERYAVIKLNGDGFCPLLTTERLCQIQKKLGADYLSHVCSQYPRLFNNVNGVAEKSGSMSCPEAARLALLNTAGIEFERSEELLPPRVSLHRRIDTTAPEAQQDVSRYLWELRVFTIRLLQDRSYTLPERLIILGMFCQKLQQQVNDGRLEETLQLIRSYAAMSSNGGLKQQVQAISPHTEFQMQLAKELTDQRFSVGLPNSRYVQLLKETLIGIRCFEGALVSEVAGGYRAAHRDYYRPFMVNHEYLLENYLVNYVFGNLFPVERSRSVFGNYVMLIVHYAVIRLHLIGLAGFHKGLTPHKVVDLIQSITKEFEHSSSYLKTVHDLLEQNGFFKMSHMAMLIQEEAN